MNDKLIYKEHSTENWNCHGNFFGSVNSGLIGRVNCRHLYMVCKVFANKNTLEQKENISFKLKFFWNH